MNYKKLILSIAICLLSVTSAQAWIKVKNNTANTVWVAEAFMTVFPGTFCSADIPGCFTNNWQVSRIRGWWQIAPGGTATVYPAPFHHTEQYRLYAEDHMGHVWGGSDRRHCVPWDVHDICNAPCPCGTGTRCLAFTNDLQPGTGCCGFTCSGTNHTFNLNP